MQSIAETLKFNTDDYHKKLEGLLLPNLHRISREEYIRFLSIQYKFHAQVEELVKESLLLKRKEWCILDRSKTGAIQADLFSFGEEPENPENNSFATFSEAQILGLVYVGEGGQLGGRVILKRMQQLPWFDPRKNGRFLYGYGNKTGLAWKSFLNLLNSEERNLLPEMTDGARAGFSYFISEAISQTTIPLE